MKDTEIHNNLPEKELRDFFSKSIRIQISSDVSMEQKKNYKLNENDPYFNTIENIKIDLIRLEKEKEKFENLRSIHRLMQIQGWTENDCSDWVSRTNGEKFCLSFIGTDEEFKKFMIDNEFQN